MLLYLTTAITHQVRTLRRCQGSAPFLIRVLAIYGAFFIGFPIVRFLGTTILHIGIAKRNEKRKANYELVASPTRDLRKKLDEARSYKQKQLTITADKIAYDSERDLLEQEIEHLPER